jgi:hypothetical protein
VLRRLDVLHDSPGRLRVRATTLKGEAASLGALAAKIADLPRVRAARANPETGSILVLHDDDVTALTAALSRHDALLAAVEPPAPLSTELARELAGVGAALEHRLGAGVDVRGLGAIALLAIAVMQISRGHVFMPAATAIWYALNLLQRSDGSAKGPEPR